MHTHPKLSFLCRSTMLQLAFYDAVTLNSTLHPPNIKLNWFERHKSTSQNYFSSQRQKKKIPFRETHILTENWALCSHRNSSFTNLWSKALKTRRDKKKKTWTWIPCPTSHTLAHPLLSLKWKPVRCTQLGDQSLCARAQPTCALRRFPECTASGFRAQYNWSSDLSHQPASCRLQVSYHYLLMKDCSARCCCLSHCQVVVSSFSSPLLSLPHILILFLASSLLSFLPPMLSPLIIKGVQKSKD